LLDTANNEQKDEIKDVISEVVPTYRNLEKERTKNIQ